MQLPTCAFHLLTNGFEIALMQQNKIALN